MVAGLSAEIYADKPARVRSFMDTLQTWGITDKGLKYLIGISLLSKAALFGLTAYSTEACSSVEAASINEHASFTEDALFSQALSFSDASSLVGKAH